MGMSRGFALVLVLVFLTNSFILAPLTAIAEPRTIVVPEDYRTIADAIGNATNGDTIFVKKGTYRENPLKINKTLSLIGEGADSTKISFNPPSTEVTVSIYEHYIFYEDPIKVNADDFTLSGFTVNTTGGSISISGNKTRIANNVINCEMHVAGGSYSAISENQFTGDVGFNGTYCKVSSNNFWGNLYGGGQYVIFSSNNCHWGSISIQGNDCLVTDNHLADSSSWFKVIGNDNIVSKNTVTHVGFGLSVAGLNSKAFLNQITHCGIALIPSPGSVFSANYIADNGWDIDTRGSLINPNGSLSTLFHNNFVNNRYQVDTMSSYQTDYFDNGKEGNYWSDYRGPDANGDGIGDTAYVIDDNRSDRYPLVSPFDFSSVPNLITDWAAAPTVQLISPQNITYDPANVSLNFVVNKQASAMSFSLDGGSNITITQNITLTNLPSGPHNVTVYAKDEFENMGNSETIYFSVEVPFPTTLTIVTTVSVAVVGAGLLVYLKKRKSKHGPLAV